jgi:signal transduction histidine kinase
VGGSLKQEGDQVPDPIVTTHTENAPQKSLRMWRSPKSFQQRIIAAGFIVATLLLAFLFVMAYRANSSFVRWNTLVVHTREVMGTLEKFSADVKSSQVAAVDYYSNGSEQQARVFETAQADARNTLIQLRPMISDNPAQVKNLDTLSPLSDQALNLLGEVIQLHRDGKTGVDGLKSVNEGARKITPPLVKALAEMIAEENSLLETRTAEAGVTATKARRLQVGGGISAVVLLIFICLLFLRENSIRANIEGQLEETNSQLEQRVDQITRDITERKRLEEGMTVRTAQLEIANKELEAFCYSVSHDLRAPLRAIDGFSQAVLEDCGDQLNGKGKEHLQRVRAASTRMGTLIDDLLNLSRISRAEMRFEAVNISQLADEIARELRAENPERKAEFVIAQDLRAKCDPHLVQVALQNLIGNSWKFASKKELTRIEIGYKNSNGSSSFFVTDNGAGFDPAHADRLFGAFQRLHSVSEFPGTGIGLATVQRIINRHGGKIWAKAEVDRGATFYFTLQT